MGQTKINHHNEIKNGQLQNSETNCNICDLKKLGLCPYLERLMKCHIFNGLKGQKVFNGINKEKRRYRRILTSIPAFIGKNGSEKASVPIGSIMDISLGGLRVSIPRGVNYKLLTGSKKTAFEIIFTLPG